MPQTHPAVVTYAPSSRGTVDFLDRVAQRPKADSPLKLCIARTRGYTFLRYAPDSPRRRHLRPELAGHSRLPRPSCATSKGRLTLETVHRPHEGIHFPSLCPRLTPPSSPTPRARGAQ